MKIYPDIMWILLTRTFVNMNLKLLVTEMSSCRQALYTCSVRADGCYRGRDPHWWPLSVSLSGEQKGQSRSISVNGNTTFLLQLALQRKSMAACESLLEMTDSLGGFLIQDLQCSEVVFSKTLFRGAFQPLKNNPAHAPVMNTPMWPQPPPGQAAACPPYWRQGCVQHLPLLHCRIKKSAIDTASADLRNALKSAKMFSIELHEVCETLLLAV